jgi:murein DD-endopeptidase
VACLLGPPPALAAGDFDMAVPVAPRPVTIDGREWLIYELHLANATRGALHLAKVEVISGTSDVLQVFEGYDLAKRIASEGERRVVYLEVPLSSKRPRLLRHRIADEVGGETAVVAKAGLALAPPLRGGPWAAVYAWEWPRGHRRVFYTIVGRARLPGRLAIDWVRKDEQGRSARGDADIVKNSLGYGAEVLAVANARVAAVRDGVAESERVSANPKHALDEKAGNYVSLDLGDGRFAVYEHLAPGSIRVARGDRVQRGQVIASLGFTGDSTEPHLHFHVADDPSPLKGEGLPFELEQFRVQGPGPGSGQLRRRERPAPNSLVTFD